MTDNNFYIYTYFILYSRHKYVLIKYIVYTLYYKILYNIYASE